MKKMVALFIIFLLVVLSATVICFQDDFFGETHSEPFHVGVTYGGDSIQEALLLIDKVKDYTNLFVLQSGMLQHNLSSVEQVCDYAVDSGLDIIVYFSSYNAQKDATAAFLNTAQTRWGNHFLGLYYGDESGGKMLDDVAHLYNITDFGDIHKDKFGYSVVQKNGSISCASTYMLAGTITLDYYNTDTENGTTTTYFTNGTIRLFNYYTEDFTKNQVLLYQPNGTVILQKDWTEYQVVTDKGNISQFEPYQNIYDSRPLPTYEQAATGYVENLKPTLDWVHNQTDANIFTSDYALYWWDYQSGYDVVFAELGWNNTVAQEIGLVRGAAKMQDKNWGTIITWTYNHPPYLTNGEEMYDQMRTSYECGANYVIIYNHYDEGMNNTYGTLQEEHFQALEQFWNKVVKDPFAAERGSIKSEAVLVLPQNYGWGMRTQNDKIWGILDADESSQQIWEQTHRLLEQHGTKLDIVYEDPKFPVEGKYPTVVYWNQTSG
ncbi:MAG: hypothetical protein WC325_07070 [Candidatus Bathyarchaeia archaeon]|jgi:hypothetical protein